MGDSTSNMLFFFFRLPQGSPLFNGEVTASNRFLCRTCPLNNPLRRPILLRSFLFPPGRRTDRPGPLHFQGSLEREVTFKMGAQIPLDFWILPHHLARPNLLTNIRLNPSPWISCIAFFVSMPFAVRHAVFLCELP